MSGEYGNKFERPHYHLCLFNFLIEDKIPHPPEMQNSPGEILYDSPSLKKIWGKGNVVIGRLTFETAAYTARYIMKKVTGEKAGEYYGKREPEYCQMSRRPGIAGLWFQEYAKDVLKTDKIITRSLTTKCPKYYDKLIEKIDPILMKGIKDERLKRLSEKDMTLRRLREKEEYKELKIKTLRRGYEKWQFKKLSHSTTEKAKHSESQHSAITKPKPKGVYTSNF